MHMSDFFINIIAYVSYLLKSVEAKQPLYEDVKNEINRLFQESEKHGAKEGIPAPDYDQARFAVCAWVDEAILGSKWQYKNRWLNDQLQRQYYNTTDAGEEFFERLHNIGLHQRDIREVYYLCLAGGFTGKFCHPGDEFQLEQIKTSNLKLLLGSSVGLPSLERSELFHEAYPSGTPEIKKQKQRSGARLVKLISIIVPVALFCILYLVFRFTLSGVSENFLRTVGN